MKNDGKNAKNVDAGDQSSLDSHDSHPIIPPRGDYQTLHSFHKAEVVYDLTFRFAHKYLAKGDRTVDQMIQAARSGKKICWKAAKPRSPPRKPRSSSPTWAAPAWKSCSTTTAITSA